MTVTNEPAPKPTTVRIPPVSSPAVRIIKPGDVMVLKGDRGVKLTVISTSYSDCECAWFNGEALCVYEFLHSVLDFADEVQLPF